MNELIVCLLLCSFLAVAILFGLYGVGGRASTLAELGCIAIAVVVGMLFGTGISWIEGQPLLIYLLCTYMCLIATVAAAAPRIVYRSLFAGEQIRIVFLFRLSAYAAVILTIGSNELLTDQIISLRFGLIVLVFVALFYCLLGVLRMTRRWWLVAMLGLPLCYGTSVGFNFAFEMEFPPRFVFMFYGPFYGSIHFCMWVSIHLFYLSCWIAIILGGFGKAPTEETEVQAEESESLAGKPAGSLCRE
ncbi:MAG: hypothetical protein AAF483_02980 [Planctomycetota bacterium]